MEYLKDVRKSFKNYTLHDQRHVLNVIDAMGGLLGDYIEKLTTGENLYENSDVFVRELLQNAIDATLLRGEMDSGFVPEDSRIDLWQWNDREGNVWFRIDDQGTGMTLGMLRRYFLKVGNSYYTSHEIERDLYDHGQSKSYYGISRFGIGFLSCFLCGEYVEVSTLYFDPEKNRREERIPDTHRTIHYGLHLKVTGLTGYYMLKNQAMQHRVDEILVAPDWYIRGGQEEIERYGYRSKPGTSIVIRFNPGKLGTLDLRKAAEKYLCGAKIPIYFNNERIGRTYGEVIQMAHRLAGEGAVEISTEVKREFDKCFPYIV